MMTRLAASPLFRVLCFLTVLASCGQAQTVTGPQSIAFAGLRTVASQGQFNAVKADTAGNLYLLLDQKDGVRILKSDPTATNILAQAQLGAKGDIGLSLALDPAGNVYVAGTTTSTTLTGTSAVAFPTRTGTSTNSFVAKFDPSLNNLFVTFAGSGQIAAASLAVTGDSVFLSGSIFSATLPVTNNGILQSPAYASQQNGFVERFSSDGSTLIYATYLTGAQGNTSPSAIVADTADNAYITGSTTSSGYPTVAALIPRIAPGATSSGFLTKLSPLGDAITVSTFIPGTGITSLALDLAGRNLLLSGNVALGQFPITNAQSPLVSTPYQVLLRLPLDASAVVASTVIAPGTSSFVTPAPNAAAWVEGSLSTPLLPLTPLSEIGGAFAARITSSNVIDQTARFGGLPATNPNYASAPVIFTSVTTDATGQPVFAGAFNPTSDASLIATEQYDLPLTQPPTATLPSSVTDTPVTSCNGSLCPGSAAYLSKLNLNTNTASLILSTGAAPDVVLRNLGSAQANNLQISATGFTFGTSCGTKLVSGAECVIALSGTGPGTLTVQAANAPTQTSSIASTSASPTPIVFSPRELDFGIQTATSAPISRTLTIMNVSHQTQAFSSALDFTSKAVTAPFSQSSTDCTMTSSATLYTLAPGASCHITFAFALNSSTPDGPVQYPWTVSVSGTHDVLLRGYAQAASLGLSATEIDFGTQFISGLRTTRSLFLSNNSDTAITHTAVALPAASPFTVTDLCPLTLLPHTICQLLLAYNSPTSPTDDSTTLSLDNGLSVLVTGQTLPQPGVNAATVNPNLSVTPSSVVFVTPVAVTAHSTTTQTVTIANTGTSSFSLNLNITGDFTQTTTCPANLPAGSSCSVTLTFTPTAPGTREGLVAVTAGAGTSPVYVTLTGTATAILTGNNGSLDFGGIPITEPVVQWYKVSQSFTTFSATATGAWKVFLSEDIGYGHATPAPSAFQTSATGTCFNCYIGVQFEPTSTGGQTGSLILSSASASTPYVLSLTGTGLPLTGLLVSPTSQDFGAVPVHSKSQSFLFSLTNMTTALTPITVATPTVTGDFAVSTSPSGGSSCTGTLGVAANCYVEVLFAPTATGPRTGTLTFPTSAGSATVSLTGYAEPDPGISLASNALTFQNVPGLSATQQTVTISNTGTSTVTVGTVSTATASFAASSNCANLAAAASCTATVTYLPGSAPSADTLTIPVTTTSGGAPTLTNYTVPLTGAYTSQTAGLQILPALTDFGPGIVNDLGLTRTFTLNNLTAKAVNVVLSLPRQFVLTVANPCPTLPANGSCTFSVTYLPQTSSIATGTLYAQATSTDGTTSLTGLAYLQGYGTATTTASLTITGPLSPGTGILDFGRAASGQTVSRTLTLTSTAPGSVPAPNQQITIRRITSEPPFLSTTTCGNTLNAGNSCTITVIYTATNQISQGSTAIPAIINTGNLLIESDSPSSPTSINLTGSASAVSAASPSNSIPINTFTLSQGSLTFPPTATGYASPNQTISVTNTGTAILHIIGLTTTSDFTTTNNCPQITTTCTITVAFTPQLQSQTTALHTGTLEILSDSGVSLEYISLFGLSSPAQLGVLPTSLNFGSVVVGQKASLPVQVTNTGTVPVLLSRIMATSDYAASGNCPTVGGSLAPATSCTIQAIFTPTATGVRTGTLSIATSASALPLTVSLTGSGTQAQLVVAPSSLNFGSIALGASANQSLTLTNTGTAPVTNLALTITGDYAVTVPCSAGSLAPGVSCTVTVTFTPSATGSRPSALIVSSADPNSPANIPLNGTGVQNGSFLLTVNGGSSASASVRQGYPAVYTLTVSPTGNFAGNVVLNCSPVTPVEFASCSMLPSSLTLAVQQAQSSTLTINTVTSIQTSSLDTRVSTTLLCLLAPVLTLGWKSRQKKFLPLLALLVWAIVPVGCGGGPNPNLRYTPPGTYSFQVTANSTTGTQITQSVTVTLVVTN